ncbi:hypothetical protein ACJ41O_014731 [Fusarium nematophilum]
MLLRHHAIEGVDGRFWTGTLLRHILTRERVQAELQRPEHRFPPADARRLVDIVYPRQNSSSRSYLEILALLLLGGRARDLPAFINEGVSDEELPVLIQNALPGWPVCTQRRPKQPLRCFESWPMTDREVFVTNQMQVTTPFLGLAADGSCDEFTLHPKAVRPWRKAESPEAEDARAGAYSRVSKVHIHPTSHAFSRPLSTIHLGSTEFAVKTLHKSTTNSEHMFQRELEHLKRFNGFVHKHLVTTLAAFRRGDDMSFIFPSAACDLEELLERPNPPWDVKGVRWAAKQIAGLMGAVDTVHEPKHLKDREKKYGRHGDIKRDNILCFPQPGAPGEYTLVLCDFGMSALNSKKSRSNIPRKQVPPVPGYRPPECDIEGGTVSRAFDIWCLGCLFLEFITWLVGGPAAVEEFESRRTTLYITGARNDIFFVLKTVKGSKTYVAQVKPEVTQWIQHLRSLPRCSQFVRDVLDLIENEMLVVLEANRARSPSGLLLAKLEAIQSKCRDPAYCLQQAPPQRRDAARGAPAVEANLNDFAKQMLEDHHVRLPFHIGRTNKPLTPEELARLDDPGSSSKRR